MSNSPTGNDEFDQQVRPHDEPSTRLVEESVNGLRNQVLAIMFVIFAAGFSAASDIYIAQNAAGGNTGVDCADAYAKSYLDTPSNWKAGNTYHLCGTFNAPAGSSEYIVVGGTGSSGNVITLKFETGALLTAPYWSGAVIDLNGQSYIIVDGGTNGTIQATANGTNLANQQDNGACVIDHSGPTPTEDTVQNLTCSNLYVDASPSDNNGENTYGIDIWNTDNLVEQNNTLHDMKWAIRVSYQVGSTFSNLTITGNNIYNMDHGVFIGDSNSSGSAVMSGFYIYGNTVGSMTNWDNTDDNNHHDWFHLNANSVSTRFTNFYLYNNYGNGDVGANANGGFFTFPNAVASESGLYMFNNLFVNTSTSHCWANGFISEYLAGSLMAVNNTFVSNASSCKDNGLDYNNSSTGLTFGNNIMQNTANASVYASSGVTISSLDYTNYYQQPSWFSSGNWYTSLSGWQSATGYDSNGTAGNPKLTSSYHLSDSSSASWQSGQNLYSVCNGQPNPGLGALCYDKAGVARPSTGKWDIGAYYDSGGNNLPPNPPTGLTAVVN